MYMNMGRDVLGGAHLCPSLPNQVLISCCCCVDLSKRRSPKYVGFKEKKSKISWIEQASQQFIFQTSIVKQLELGSL